MEIKLTYFKQSGKYYTSGKYTTRLGLNSAGVVNMYEVADEVKSMRINKKLPGVSHGLNFFIIVDCDEGYPVLLHPLESE